MNDFRAQWAETSSAVLEAVRSVGESGWYVLGERVQAFEASFANTVDRRAAIGCASGLDAIELGLRALGLAQGERVLTTPLSAFATSLAIVRAGGVPVFVDVDESGQIDLTLVARHLRLNPEIRFLVPVHLYGHCMNLEQLAAIRDEFDLKIVEDCCQAIAARFQGRAVGTVGQVAAYSFYPTKNLGALGDGGAVVTDDPGLQAKCRALRDYGQTAKYQHDFIGLNSRLDELQAAVLDSALLPRLAAWTERRRLIARTYAAGMHNPAVSSIPVPRGSESVWHLFPVLVADGARDAFMKHLAASGVQSQIHYPTVIPDQPAAGANWVEFGALERARNIASRTCSIPINPFLGDDQVRHTLATVNAFELG
jgi:dTDP-3-amino-3,4,6-trideoxy-alpha-D-glucose transaminase